MMTLLITAVAILAALTLGIMYLVGLFNKKISIRVNLTFGFIRTLKISWRNIRRLPSRFYLLLKILPYKRRLLFSKISKRLRIKRQERRKRRRERRRLRKARRQKQRLRTLMAKA